LLLIVFAATVLQSSASAATLTLLKDAVNQGAMCLDGTPTGYYFSPAASSDHANDWQIYFQGGGWCYSEADCWGRSKTTLGSSLAWGSTMSAGGLLSDDCNVNPDFCQFNRVFLPYCDGDSFSGNRDDPLVYNGDKVWFRGLKNLDAAMRDLYDNKNLSYASNVLLTGCSAGGLATYLHTDYVHRWMPPTVQKYKAASISGYFLQHETVEYKPVYPNEMSTIYYLANATSGVSAECVADKAPGYEWECNFAPEAYKYIHAPFFAINSIYDSWQVSCILTAEPVPANSTANGACNAISSWTNCINNPEACTNAQMPQLNEFGQSLLDNYHQVSNAAKAGNGAFLHSCHTHCEAQDDHAFNTYAVNGVTMQKAVSAWWNSDNEAASAHTYDSCLYNANATPRQCNPTCNA